MSLANLSSTKYRCGYCGEDIASNQGYYTETSHNLETGHIFICHHCTKPTFIDISGNKTPGSSFGNIVEHIPNNEISELFDEARRCISVNAYTASILCSRKLLMNIAVSKGADIGLSFQKYVDYIASQGYVPPDGKAWVDHIREKGNEATHEIQMMKREDAQDLITFIEMLLKFMYEFPAKMREKQVKK